MIPENPVLRLWPSRGSAGHGAPVVVTGRGFAPVKGEADTFVPIPVLTDWSGRHAFGPFTWVGHGRLAESWQVAAWASQDIRSPQGIKLFDSIWAKIGYWLRPSGQWNLARLYGSVETERAMLAKYNGAGVHVAVYDDGLDKSVGALMTHYDASRELTLYGAKADPGILNTNTEGEHGTAVSGIIAADPTKTKGKVTGIASGATLTAVNIFTGDAWLFAQDAVAQMVNFDVTNCSWGWGEKWTDIQLVTGTANAVLEANQHHALIDALNNVGKAGRGGLGTVVVKAAGNERHIDHRDAATQQLNVDRHVVTVGAMGSDNCPAYYSDYGASILTSAPSSGASLSITTTDRTGEAGYDSSDYTVTFGGTSAAAPEVTGTVADMLGANGKLGARDVQVILALASHDIDYDYFTTSQHRSMDYRWMVNHAAGDFNGGGYHFVNDEGFGALNAHDAIREAVVWSYMNPVAQTFVNEVHLSATAPGRSVPATASGATFTFVVTGAEIVENADLNLNIDSANLNNLKVVLTHDTGTQSIVLDTSTTLKTESLNSVIKAGLTLGSHAFLGESAAGVWTAQVIDTHAEDKVSINAMTLDLYGSAPRASHVFHYTDEASKMIVFDKSRITLHDKLGVGSWIDTSMMTFDETIDLHTGGTSAMYNSVFHRDFVKIGADTTISNVTLGDGVCTVLCNDNGDTVVAGSNIAKITGGSGNDRFIAGFGSETVSGGGGADTFVFDHKGFGTATITDFATGVDHIDLKAFGLHFGDLHITDNGMTITISQFDAVGDRINLTNTHNQHLTAGDFLFA